MVSGLNEAQFLISCHRKNSVRDKMIDKKQICLGKKSYTDRVWDISEGKKYQGMGLSVFTEVGNFIG